MCRQTTARICVRHWHGQRSAHVPRVPQPGPRHPGHARQWVACVHAPPAPVPHLRAVLYRACACTAAWAPTSGSHWSRSAPTRTTTGPSGASLTRVRAGATVIPGCSAAAQASKEGRVEGAGAGAAALPTHDACCPSTLLSLDECARPPWRSCACTQPRERVSASSSCTHNYIQRQTPLGINGMQRCDRLVLALSAHAYAHPCRPDEPGQGRGRGPQLHAQGGLVGGGGGLELQGGQEGGGRAG